MSIRQHFTRSRFTIACLVAAAGSTLVAAPQAGARTAQDDFIFMCDLDGGQPVIHNEGTSREVWVCDYPDGYSWACKANTTECVNSAASTSVADPSAPTVSRSPRRAVALSPAPRLSR